MILRNPQNGETISPIPMGGFAESAHGATNPHNLYNTIRIQPYRLRERIL